MIDNPFLRKISGVDQKDFKCPRCLYDLIQEDDDHCDLCGLEFYEHQEETGLEEIFSEL